MKRIAILAQFPRQNSLLKLGRGAGVAATWLSQYAQSLAESHAEFDVSWLTLDKSIRRLECYTAWNQKFIRIPTIKSSLDIVTGYLYSKLRLIEQLKSLNPNIIHIWGTEGPYASILGACRARTILSMQGILTEYNRIGSFKTSWFQRFQAKYEPTWVRKADVITCESQWGAECIKRIAPHATIHLVEYGVHPSFYEVEWKPSPQTPTFLFVGTVDWRKGADILVEAARHPSRKQWKLRIAGEGPYLKSMTNIEGIELLGNLDWQNLQAHLAQSWALVLPTRADTSPNAIKEARVIGLPVVTTRYGGQVGYIRDGVNGRIMEKLSGDCLCEILNCLSSSYDEILSLGRSTQAQDRSYFHPEKTKESFSNIYRSLN
jgi:glycosyltransferase involved in cell wall biosynthesis